MKTNCSSREFLGAMSMVAGAAAARPLFASSMQAPASRMANGLCPEYDRRVGDSLAVMFDHLGGLERLVRRKTVAVKLNMTGPPGDKLNSRPNQMTHWVHPQVIGALVALLGKAVSTRIRLLDTAPLGAKPLEDFMIAAGW